MKSQVEQQAIALHGSLANVEQLRAKRVRERIRRKAALAQKRQDGTDSMAGKKHSLSEVIQTLKRGEKVLASGTSSKKAKHEQASRIQSETKQILQKLSTKYHEHMFIIESHASKQDVAVKVCTDCGYKVEFETL